MALTDFTSYSEIRSALGVSIDEIGDAELGLSLYELGLKVELKSISKTLSDDYLAAKATIQASRTEEEEDLVTATHLFATYSVARQLTTSLPLFSPKEQSDNKAMLVRYSDNPYKEVMKGIEKNFEKYASHLQTVYDAFKATTTVKTVRSYMSVVQSTTTDPITGS